MTPQILQLILTLEPLALPLIKDIASLFKAHPALTPDMIVALVTAIHQTDSATLATIAADEATHPNG